MRKLHVGFMKDLRNHVFHTLYDIIIKTVEDEHIEDLDIQANLERAKSHQDRFKYAFAKRERNPYAVANDELIGQRTQCLMMLRNRLKSYLPSFIPQEQAAAKRIHFVMRQYGKKYYVRSNKTQADLVDKLNYHINKGGDFKDALTTLGFNGLMGQINELTQEINQNYKQYITTSTQIQVQRKGVRKAAYIDLKIMIEGIMYKFHTCRGDQTKRDELEVLMENINITLKHFSTLLKSLKTQRANQRAAQKEKEAALEKVQAKPQKTLPVDGDPSTTLSEHTPESLEITENSKLSSDKIDATDTVMATFSKLETLTSTSENDIKDRSLTVEYAPEDLHNSKSPTNEVLESYHSATNKRFNGDGSVEPSGNSGG